jgi:hypothetical protein
MLCLQSSFEFDEVQTTKKKQSLKMNMKKIQFRTMHMTQHQTLCQLKGICKCGLIQTISLVARWRTNNGCNN